MKNLFVLLVATTLIGCASTKYPGWEQVNVVTELPKDKECHNLLVNYSNYGGDDLNWFKKRAIMYKANTVLVRTFSPKTKDAEFYNCHRILPKLSFDAQHYKVGSNDVTGQAFLTQKGGGVVTCAGQTVTMLPNTPYYTANKADYNVEPSDEATKLIKTAQCDAQGNFEFEKIPDGEWLIYTGVNWEVPHYIYLGGGNSVFVDLPQGGIVKKVVAVKPGQKNRFIVTHQ